MLLFAMLYVSKQLNINFLKEGSTKSSFSESMLSTTYKSLLMDEIIGLS